MRRADDMRAWIAVGVLGSMLLGIALIPLRAHTTASNLAFAFLALTIAVAELGGRAAALTTALASALSLDFFLTEPYLDVTISKQDDVIAFSALVVCGLIAAAFGRRRERWSDLAARAGEELGAVRKLVAQLGEGTPLDQALDALRENLGLQSMILRTEDEQVLASAPFDAIPAPPARTALDPETLLPRDESRLRFGPGGLRLPTGGGRIPLRPPNGRLAFLDLWEGDTRGLGIYETSALAISVSLLELELARRPPVASQDR